MCSTNVLQVTFVLITIPVYITLVSSQNPFVEEYRIPEVESLIKNFKSIDQRNLIQDEGDARSIELFKDTNSMKNNVMPIMEVVDQYVNPLEHLDELELSEGPILKKNSLSMSKSQHESIGVNSVIPEISDVSEFSDLIKDGESILGEEEIMRSAIKEEEDGVGSYPVVNAEDLMTLESEGPDVDEKKVQEASEYVARYDVRPDVDEQKVQEESEYVARYDVRPDVDEQKVQEESEYVARYDVLPRTVETESKVAAGSRNKAKIGYPQINQAYTDSETYDSALTKTNIHKFEQGDPPVPNEARGSSRSRSGTVESESKVAAGSRNKAKIGYPQINQAYTDSETYDSALTKTNIHKFEQGDPPVPNEARGSSRSRSGTVESESKVAAGSRNKAKIGYPQINQAYTDSETYDSALTKTNSHKFEEGDPPVPNEARGSARSRSGTVETESKVAAGSRNKAKIGYPQINQAYTDSETYDAGLTKTNLHKFEEGDPPVPNDARGRRRRLQSENSAIDGIADPEKYVDEYLESSNRIAKAVAIKHFDSNDSDSKVVPTYGVELEDVDNSDNQGILYDGIDAKRQLKNLFYGQELMKDWEKAKQYDLTTDITLSEQETAGLKAFMDAISEESNADVASKTGPISPIYFGPNIPQEFHGKSLGELIEEKLSKNYLSNRRSSIYNVNPNANDVFSSDDDLDSIENRREKGRREIVGKEPQAFGINDLLKDLYEEGKDEVIERKFGRQAEGETENDAEGEEANSPNEAESDDNMGELPDSSGDSSQMPYVEWCEGKVRKRINSMDCTEITFVPPFPSCYCVEGIVSIRLDTSKNCETGLQFAKSGCFNFEALGHGVRSIRLESNLDTKTFVVATERKNDFTSNWDFHIPSENAAVNNIDMTHNVQVLNGELFQDDEGSNCVQQLKTEIVRVYRGIYGNYNVTNEDFQRCPGFAIGDSRLVMEHPVIGKDFQLCTPTCPPYQSAESSDKEAQLSSQLDLGRDDLADKEMSCKPIPLQLKSLHDDLNTKILRRSIDSAFMKPNSDTFVYEPQSTFKLLETMADIALKLCREAGLPRRILDVGIDLFKVAHEGRGYYFNEGIEPKRYRFMHDALTSCLQNTIPYTFKKTDCDGTITHVVNGTEFVPIALSEDHEHFDHHVVLDIPWNIVDLINIACVDSFHHSYRMYHEMEQGMEKLYTKELRSLWKYPDFPRNFYERLFGAYWEHTAKNFELCVEGAYLATSKTMWRLNRPTWIPGKGKGTRSERICKRRRTNDPDRILSTMYEVYCENLECK